MTKPGDLTPPPRNDTPRQATPGPEITVIEDGDADPTPEWSLGPLVDSNADHNNRGGVPGNDATVAPFSSAFGGAPPVGPAPAERLVTAPPIPAPRIKADLTPPPYPTLPAIDDEVVIEEVPAPGGALKVAPPPVPPLAPTEQAGPPPMPPILLPDLPATFGMPTPGGAWPEALSQRPRKKRLKPWFEEVFDEDYLRTLPFMTAEQTLREVAFISEALNPPTDGQILDVACGYGRHAIELSQRGLRITGLDLSLPLLIRAADESQKRALSVNFVHADMREMTFDGQFDGAYCMLSSFGYFDEETNLKVATSICRALKPGGRLLLDTLNRDYIVGELPMRIWWEGDGCVVLEEVDFNFHTSRVLIRRSVVFQDGRQVEHEISIRAYSLHELGKLLRQAGFRVLDVSGSLATKSHFFGGTSRNIIMVCERPAG